MNFTGQVFLRRGGAARRMFDSIINKFYFSRDVLNHLPLFHPDPGIGFICRTTKRVGSRIKVTKIGLETFPPLEKSRPPP